MHDFIHGKLLELRIYRQSDIDPILQLFYDTVHIVNAKDYTQNQLDVWATGQLDKDAWDHSLSTHYTVVAEIADKVVGFGDLDGSYLDRLYVHKDYQGQGIATAIMDNLVQQAFRNGKITCTTHSSITARPFFEQRGYGVIKEQQVDRSGVLLTNFVMEKQF